MRSILSFVASLSALKDSFPEKSSFVFAIKLCKYAHWMFWFWVMPYLFSLSNDRGCFVIAIVIAAAIAIAYASDLWSETGKSFSLVSFLSLLSLSTPTASTVISTYTIHTWVLLLSVPMLLFTDNSNSFIYWTEEKEFTASECATVLPIKRKLSEWIQFIKWRIL